LIPSFQRFHRSGAAACSFTFSGCREPAGDGCEGGTASRAKVERSVVSFCGWLKRLKPCSNLFAMTKLYQVVLPLVFDFFNSNSLATFFQHFGSTGRTGRGGRKCPGARG